MRMRTKAMHRPKPKSNGRSEECSCSGCPVYSSAGAFHFRPQSQNRLSGKQFHTERSSALEGITLLIVVSAAIGGIFILITALSYLYGLKGIKAKTAGNGQHGTARWATNREIKKTYRLPRKNGGRIRAADRRSKALWLAVYPKRKRQRHLWTRVMFIV